MWNSYLLDPVKTNLHSDWLLSLVHGFVGQSNINTYGKSLYLTLIARRSSRYAGTRFLKRGCNEMGNVANEVETEQILSDSSVSSFHKGRFTSYVQLRGSVPSLWGQDVSKMVPKPPIAVYRADPYHQVAGAHFSQLLCRYGSPLVVVSLVKRREKKPHESILSAELEKQIEYLNLFLPPVHHINLLPFDMARMNKRKDFSVMSRLGEIAHKQLLRTGIFQNFRPPHCHSLRAPPMHKILEERHNNIPNAGFETFEGRRQTGVVRVNCVDCLDRTNTAQFAIGKLALGLQLQALGVISCPTIDFDTDAMRILEAVYEDHGDTLALQYGGSQLVHRIKTYRRTAPWASQSNDIMQTISRYVANTFSDTEKQMAINLFLGIFAPKEGSPALWESSTDYYLHHPAITPKSTPSLSQWWDLNVLTSLPHPWNELQPDAINSQQLVLNINHETVDTYSDYYRETLFTPLAEQYASTISNSVRDFMPGNAQSFSPFCVRVPQPGPGKRRDNPSTKRPIWGAGTLSIVSAANNSSSGEGSDSDDDIDTMDNNSSESDYREGEGVVSVTLPPMGRVYGVDMRTPRRADMNLYKRYVNVGKAAVVMEPQQSAFSPSPSVKSSIYQSPRIMPWSNFNLKDSAIEVTPPVVSATSLRLYSAFVQRGKQGAAYPRAENIASYMNYVNKGY